MQGGPKSVGPRAPYIAASCDRQYRPRPPNCALQGFPGRNLCATSKPPATVPSYVALGKATADRAVLDGRLLPIRAGRIVALLDDALARVGESGPVRRTHPSR